MEQIFTYEEEDFQTKLMEERERDITNITKDIHTVKDIFVDLGNLVQDQQHNVDDIENQINASLLDTEKGVNQLDKAKNNQSTRNKCGFYIFCVALVGMVILFIVLYLR